MEFCETYINGFEQAFDESLQLAPGLNKYCFLDGSIFFELTVRPWTVGNDGCRRPATTACCTNFLVGMEFILIKENVNSIWPV